ncbi:2-dehydropantoate 2-reductase [Rhodoferax sp. AJA081-3]|uniref:2-dehydropantoate 2-reductase n=1 Tax=Rhodoferax sp. AJA081-3 TaxID=2752316 RepID=UPI001AE019AD|nr:2-dehydropantoate 2-reductase [Rhodoferax sp. AJA081-3]QTN30062.1 2-dehydropantoate 2-reductase [Rhodoferax sp. AJA081-3]
MHFIVVGAGAIGCYVGGRLAASGQRVSLVGRPAILGEIAIHGLTVSDMDGFSAHVPADRLRFAVSVADVDLSGAAVVLLCVKGGATAQAAAEIGAAFGAGTLVISLQNGVDNVQRIRDAAPHLEVVAGMVPYNVVLSSPAKVHRATTGYLQIGASKQSAEVVACCDAAGLPMVVVPDMQSVQWGKLLLNLNNPVNALSDLPLRDELMDRNYRVVLSALQTEALRAMDAAGITPAKVASAPPRLLPKVLRLPDFLFKLVAARMLRIDPSARSSMWDDVQKGRTTEIDDLCGAVVRLAQQHGTAAPANAQLLKMLQTHRAGQRLSGADLRRSLSV